MVLLVGIGTCNKGKVGKKKKKKEKKKTRRKGKRGRKKEKKGGKRARVWSSTLPSPLVFKLFKLLSLASFKSLCHLREAQDKVVLGNPI